MQELGWRENGVSDVGFSCPILVFEYVGGGKKVIPTWLGLGTCITSVSQELGEAESVFLRMNT
jgi:hypothetical protein